MGERGQHLIFHRSHIPRVYRITVVPDHVMYAIQTARVITTPSNHLPNTKGFTRINPEGLVVVTDMVTVALLR